MDPLSLVHTLTFAVFGTILDLGGSHAPGLGEISRSKASAMSAEELWARWRSRQRIEQYQDNQFYTGHYGYLDSSRRALVYTLRASKLPFGNEDITRIMNGWQELNPFPDAVPGLKRLRSQFRVVVLSNGEKHFLAHLVKNRIQYDFDTVISVEAVEVFTPNPQAYRYASWVRRADQGGLL